MSVVKKVNLKKREKGKREKKKGKVKAVKGYYLRRHESNSMKSMTAHVIQVVYCQH